MKLVKIPVGILTAGLLSSLVANANSGKIGDVLRYGLILALICISMQLLEITGGILYRIKMEKSLHRCRLYLYNQLSVSSLESLFLLGYGDIKEKLNDDFGTVTGKIVSLYPDFFTSIITFASYMLFLFIQSWQVALSLLFMVLFQIFPPIIIKKYLQVNYDNCREIEAQLTDFVISGYKGFLTIKLYDLKKWWLGELKKYHKRYMKIGASSIYTGTAESTLDELVSMILSYGVYGVIGMLILSGFVPLSQGIQAIALSGGLFGASKNIFSMIAKFSVARTAERRLCRGLPVDTGGINNDRNRVHRADILIKNATYSYDSKVIFRKVNALIKEGQTIVIKGENGTGKSTLFYLITGMIHCQDGQIEIGGIEVSRLADSSFPQDIFYLPQEDAVFNFSAEKLYGMYIPETAEKAKSMSKSFGLTEEIISREIAALSGGEKKKVFLSLAFALNPLVLLLDEPTNSLDKGSKIRLKELIRNRINSTIVISHDDVFDDISDCIYMLTKGGIELHG